MREGNDPEISFEMRCKMKESIMVRALVIPSYLLAVLTSGRWALPPVFVDSAEENRLWLCCRWPCGIVRARCLAPAALAARCRRMAGQRVGGLPAIWQRQR